jgi:3-isopropylmalate/(R)-2-methylmalate dehydratase small subunit
MNKFTTITSKVFLLEEQRVDTDQIIPARFLKSTVREDYSKWLFYDWRFDREGTMLPSPFNDPAFKKSKILVAGKDFGIGSSREHAVWALHDFGFRVIVSTSFGDIFYENALKNGLLVVRIQSSEIDEINALVISDPNVSITVDLRKQWIILPEDKIIEFTIHPFSRLCLLKGFDDISYIRSKQKEITRYETRQTK